MALISGDIMTAGNTVLSLPHIDKEKGEDWNHVSFQSGLEKVSTRTGTRIISLESREEDTGILGKVFWKLFLKGGYQGGVWLIETLRKLALENGDMKGFIEQWI